MLNVAAQISKKHLFGSWTVVHKQKGETDLTDLKFRKVNFLARKFIYTLVVNFNKIHV